MIQITPPSQFKQVPWKNGQGSTIELAINPGGSADSFDWRLSIATVAENGTFSDFSGYTRNQVLLAGNGMTLLHNGESVDRLHSVLATACYDGSSQTSATLCDGRITAFNLITRSARYRAELATYNEAAVANLAPCDHCFIYSHSKSVNLSNQQLLPAGHLMQITGEQLGELSVSGSEMIVICLFAY